MEMTPSGLWRLAAEGVAMTFRNAPGYEARLTPTASMILSGEAVADLNCIIIDESPQAEARLREFVQIVQAQNLACLVIITEAANPKLDPVARELTLQYGGTVPLMSYRPQGFHVNLGRYVVEPVQDKASLEEANQLCASAFGIPIENVNCTYGNIVLESTGVEAFVARENGTAMSSAMTTRAGSTVGIWSMATPPEHQRKGAGRAVLTATMQYHLERGAQYFYLGATEAGKPLYESVGFRTLSEAPIWIAGTSTQFSGH